MIKLEPQTTMESMQDIKNRIMGKVEFKKDQFVLDDSFDVEFDKVYILTCFDSNLHIKFNQDRSIEVVMTLGQPIASDKEYLLINPKY